MTTKINLLFFFLATLLISSCSTKESHEDENADMDEWAELDQFHMVMAESFHPYKDSANLAPARELAVEMAQLADDWSRAELPSKVDNTETKQMLSSLKVATAAFVELSKSTDDAIVGGELTKLHDLFHGLQEAWYSAGDEHGHEHEETH